MASGPFKLQDSPVPGPLTSRDHLVPSQAYEKSKGRGKCASLLHQTCPTAGVRSAKYPEVLFGNWTEATPSCRAHPRPLLHRKKELHSGHAAPILPADSTKNISILPAKPTSQQLPPKQAGGKNWNSHSSPAPSDLRFRNRGREALQLVCVASGSLVGALGVLVPTRTATPTLTSCFSWVPGGGAQTAGPRVACGRTALHWQWVNELSRVATQSLPSHTAQVLRSW